jgi:hypothetical protein
MGTGLNITLCSQGIKMVARPICLNAAEWFVWHAVSAKEQSILFQEAAASFTGAEQIDRTFELMTALPCLYMHLNMNRKMVNDTFKYVYIYTLMAVRKEKVVALKKLRPKPRAHRWSR